MTVEGSTNSHAPILVPWCNQRASRAGIFDMASSSDARELYTLWHLISPHLSFRSRAWSYVRNYVRTQRAATRCTMTTHYSVEFFEAYRVGLGMIIPDCFIGRRVAPLSIILLVSPRKGDVREYCWSASSTGRKASLTPGVKFWTKDQSCWREFCRPVYAVFGCLSAIPGHHLHGCVPIMDFLN